MLGGLLSCKPCSASDKAHDTVKIDFTALQGVCWEDSKENLNPEKELESQFKEDRQQQEQAEEDEEEDEEREEEKEEEIHAGPNYEDMSATAEVAAATAEELERAQAEARKQNEEEEARKAEARAQEIATEEEEELRKAETQVELWCKSNGYVNMDTPKRTLKGNTKYSLHTAVKHWSYEMVELLVKTGARTDVQDSRGNTPLQLAEKLTVCTNACHAARDRMVAALSSTR